MKEKVLFKSTSGVSTEKVIGTLPTGGAANMLFVKGSATDYDGIWQALTTAMITGALTAGSLSPSLIAQDSNNRFVTDSQISAWNSKANATDLNNYLPLAGGYMSGLMRFNTYGQNSIGKGTGDGASSTVYNLEIASWYGIAFKDSCYNTINIIFDTRTGKIQTKKIQVADFYTGVADVPVVSLADGTLAKKAISAAFVTESSDKRFVTDSQISNWNAKISGTTLEENGTVKSGNNANINFCNGNYIGASVFGNQVRFNLDVVNDDSRYNGTTTSPISTSFVKSKLDSKADWGHGHSWDSIYGKPGAFNVLLRENGGDRSVDSTINFSNGAYNIVQVDGNTIRYHCDVVTDNSRWADWCPNPVATNLVKSKLDGKADWGHGHSWDSIYGKPAEFNPTWHSHHWDNIDGKPLYINGSVLVSNLRFYSPNGSTLDGMNYIGHINSEVIASNGISVNELRLNFTPTYAKSSAPSGYLTLDGNRVVFVNSFY